MYDYHSILYHIGCSRTGVDLLLGEPIIIIIIIIIMMIIILIIIIIIVVVVVIIMCYSYVDK